jgi:hypothetical protein
MSRLLGKSSSRPRCRKPSPEDRTPARRAQSQRFFDETRRVRGGEQPYSFEFDDAPARSWRIESLQAIGQSDRNCRTRNRYAHSEARHDTLFANLARTARHAKWLGS